MAVKHLRCNPVGVRPSPGAAASRPGSAPEFADALGIAEVAAAEDGRTPLLESNARNALSMSV